MFQPEVLLGSGVVVLFFGLMWGFFQQKSRNRANDRVSEEATRAQYDHPDTYAADEAELKKQVRPS